MQVITIGRHSRNNIVIQDAAVSHYHTQIIRHDDGKISIVDLGSKNGTYVNKTRITGEYFLKRGDAVQIGNTRLPWENYFRTAYGPKPPKAPKTNGVLTLILGLFCMLMLVLLAVLLLTNRNRSSHSCVVDGVELDFNMTLSELREENDDATIIKYEVPSTDDNEEAVVYIQGYDYYVINNTIAVTLDESERINYFCTYHPSYRTPKGIHTGSTFGEVVKAYPSLQFSMTYYCYNYFAQRYEAAVEAYDEATCTYFMFYYSQFSSIQWESIMQVAGETDAWGSFELSYLSAYMMESIFSSVCVSLICRYNCHDESGNSSLSTTTLTPKTGYQKVVPLSGVTTVSNGLFGLAVKSGARDRIVDSNTCKLKSCIIYSCDQELERGKILNITDDVITVHAEYYYCDGHTKSEDIEVLPRTFSRLRGGKNVRRIICSFRYEQ